MNKQKILNKEAKVIDVIQGTNDWLELRKNKITGSTIMDYKNCNILSYKSYIGENDTDYTNQAMENGHIAEPIIRDYINTSYGLRFYPIVIEKTNILGSLDGITQDGKNILEVKCSSKYSNNPIYNTYYNAFTGRYTIEHIYQIQLYLYLTGAERCIYAVGTEDVIYNENADKLDKIIIDTIINRDDVIIEEIKSWIKEFNTNLKNGYFEKEYIPTKDYINLNKTLFELNQNKKELTTKIEEVKEQIIDYGVENVNDYSSVFINKGRTTTNYAELSNMLLDKLREYDIENANKFYESCFNKTTKTSKKYLSILTKRKLKQGLK